MTRREKRLRFLGWLSDLLCRNTPSAIGRRSILVEPLEARQLMAVDGFSSLLGSANTSSSQLQDFFGESALVGEGELTAEGEPANDLVAFARALTDSGARFFGAAWCPFCTQQKELFEDGYKYLPFVEVTNADRTPNQIAIDENITNYPTWEFDDGTRLEGVQTLATLAQRAGISIPQSSTPSMDTLPDVQVGIGSPLHVPIDAYDPNGNPLTVTVTSSDPNLLTAQVLTGNRSLRISTAGFGDMVFELFEDRAPVPTGRVIELAQDGFYDGIEFHRVINNFVIQGGDPTGTGAGGSTLGDFDDQFNLDLQHNRTGVLSYAKSSDDTNDSQFFITEGPQRFLDFNHSIFGQLVEGEQVREGISNTATNSSDRPVSAVVINSATVFNDTENAVVMLKPTGTGTGTATITVTVSDNEGNSTSQSFVATVVQDTANGAPFLNPIAPVSTGANTPVNVNLTSQDAEGDTVVYSVQATGSTTYGLTVNSSTGVVTVTPPSGFVGELQFVATVQQTTATTTNSTTDTQLVTVTVAQNAPTGLDLLPATDSGASSTDNLTNSQTLVFAVTGTTIGSTVQVLSGGNVVGTATSTSATTEVTVSNVTALGQGSVLFTANQVVGGQTSSESPSLAVVLDRSAPATISTGVFPTSAIINQSVSLDLTHPEEGQGLVYALTSSPSGMTINAQTGQIAWTPSSGQLGTQSLTLTLTDAAGNVANQTFSINVIEEPSVQISLSAVSLAGLPITTIGVGEQFKVQVTVQDLRPSTERTGVFAAYFDLLFDSNIIEPIATNPITHVDPYDNDQSGTVEVGLINELGAFSSRTSPLGPDSRLFAEITFVAKATGDAGLRTESADDVGNDVLLYDDSLPIALTKVDFGSSSFAVGADFEVVDDVFNFDEDSGLQSLNVLGNDTTTGSSTVLTITSVGSTSGGGTLVIATDGKSINYTSAANFNGAEVFTYTVRNQVGVERSGNVTVQIADVNDPPVALNDTFTVVQGSTNNVLEVLSNDTRGVDGNSTETLLVSAVGTGSAGGTIAIGSSGLTLRYTPAATFQGTETFTYTLSDSRGGTAIGTVSVSVGQANPPPTPQNDSFTVLEDAAQASFDVLANDTSDDSTETLSVSAVGVSNVGSQISVASDGLSILYRPAANFNGQELLTYTLRDSNGGTAIGTVTFNVTAVNDAPDAVNDTLTVLTSQASTNTLDVLANDTNVDSGETLTISAVTQPPAGSGTVSIASDGRSLTYTPPSATFDGTFAFTYTLSDGNGLTDTATVNVTVSDYTPRTISGTIATTNAQSVIGGFTLGLTGNDFAGNAVALTRQVGANGSYSFDGLAPGNYTLVRDPLPFLVDSGERIAINSGISDGDITTDLLVSGSIRPQYFDIRDFLGSTLQNSLTIAVNSDGSQNWVAPRGSWAALSAINVTAGTTPNAFTINAVDASQASVAASVQANGIRVSQIGQESSMRLLRVRGSTTDVGLVRASASTSSNASTSSLVGEGEGFATPEVASANASLAATSAMGTTSGQRQVLDTAASELQSPLSTSALSTAGVDWAMQDLMPSLRRQLSGDLEATLTEPTEQSDSVFDQL
jgi:large repetitive protein